MNEALWFISDRSGRATVTVNSSLNAVDAYRKFGFRNAGMRWFDGAGVRFQPMSRDLPEAGLTKRWSRPRAPVLCSFP